MSGITRKPFKRRMCNLESVLSVIFFEELSRLKNFVNVSISLFCSLVLLVIWCFCENMLKLVNNSSLLLIYR